MQTSKHQSIDDPAVSVIIPCYNHGQYIREAIASVEQCDRRLYEIIVVNDGSTDSRTREVLADLESEGYHVINQENQGLAASRNNGLGLARGRYILPLDADNKICPEYIRSGIEILDRRPEIGVVYGRPEYFGVGSTANLSPVTSFDLHRMVIKNYIDACAVVRKSALEQCGGYDPNFPLPGWEDWDLWLTLATKGWRFYFEDALMFSYRLRPDSMITLVTQPESIQRNLEYLCRKHACLLRQVIIELSEMSNHSRVMRYSRLWEQHGFKAMIQKALTKTRLRLRRKESGYLLK